MIIRSAISSDIPKIIKMYSDIFKIEVSESFYKWLYKRNYEFFSFVAEEGDRIIGHNAIIENNYTYNGNNIKVGLSSGGMVYPEYSGIFFQILKEQLIDFSSDIIIAFPNQNSEPFFKRLFQFNSIKKNYFSIINEDNFLIKKDFVSLSQHIKRDEDFIEWRLNNHPKNTYKKIKKNNTIMYYKEFGIDSIDIVFVNNFNEDFYDIIIELLEEKNKLNIVHWDKVWIESLGFKPEQNNSFVYKWNEKIDNNIPFECQMIDSDVF